MSNKLEFDHKTAAEYDKGIRRNLPTYDPMLRLSQTFLRANLKEKASLLIVGGGGGNELNALGPTNTEWKFTVVDPSKAMLEVAAMKTEQLDMGNRVEFVEGTIERIPSDHTFDAATCILVLHFIPDINEKLKLLKHIKSLLQPNAPFVLVSKYGDPNSLEFKELINLWKNYWLDTTNLSEQKVEELMASTLTEASISEEEIRRLLSEAGFHRIAHFFKTNHFGGWICHAL